MAARTGLVMLAVVSVGCVGQTEMAVLRGQGASTPGGSFPATEPPAWVPGTDFSALECQSPTPGPAPMRRLSHVEYRYVLEDLFGSATVAADAASLLVSDPVSLGFSNSAQLLDVKPVLAQQYQEAAERVAETLTQNLMALLGCDLAKSGELACAQQFTRTLLTKAYRRPPSAAEEAAYHSRYQALRDAAYDFKTGIEWIVSTVLQAPEFLYRVESDVGVAPGVRPLTALERATRLSFLVWHSIPDGALVSAAVEGHLETLADVEREARRLLADPRGTRLTNFLEEWLDVDKLGEYPRDPTVFGTLPAGLPRLFREETRRFVRHVVFEAGAKLPTLLTADFTFASSALAQHYGLPATGSTSFEKVTLPAGRRGVWMQGGPLTSHDKQHRTSIVNRGLRARTALLCNNIPAPPNNVNLTLPPVDETASQAERLAQHRTDPTCAGCHQLMDPMGQVFENVDAVGKVRTTDEAGRLVVTTGEVTATQDADGAVADGVELLDRLARSAQVSQCFANQLFRYVHGREERMEDGCSQKQAYDRFAQSGFDIRELVVGIVSSDAFLYRTVTF